MHSHSHFLPELMAVAALLACNAAHAVPPAFEDYTAASDEDLDAMRGGFEINLNGMHLMLAFSLEQLTYVNGELVSSMKLTPLSFTPAAGNAVAGALPASGATPTSPVPTSSSSSTALPGQASQIAFPTQTTQSGTTAVPVATQIFNNQGIVTLVQNGTGNTFTLPQSLSSLTTVIQNTVNDQVIRNLTVLNATLSIQQAAAAMRLGAALNHAIAASVH